MSSGLPPLAEDQLAMPPQLSHVDGRRNWAWWALRDGYLASARKHALRALLGAAHLRQVVADSLSCALRGR